METLTRPILDWHVESVPLDGNLETGDHGIARMDGDRAFIVAIDALGHGSDAARVAGMAMEHLAGIVADRPLEAAFESCHEYLRGTRGIALCLATIDARDGTLSWLSVGNIQAVHVRMDGNGMPQFEPLIMRGGVVGDRMPELRASTAQLIPGDTLVLATDGIGYGWYGEYRRDMSPEALAKALRTRHRHDHDDALVLVGRYRGLNDEVLP